MVIDRPVVVIFQKRDESSGQWSVAALPIISTGRTAPITGIQLPLMSPSKIVGSIREEGLLPIRSPVH